jgi:hypothetical protein
LGNYYKNKMKLFKWLDSTNPIKKGICREKQRELSALRRRVCAKASTNIASLRNMKCQGRYGKNILGRMISATRDEDIKITE